MDLGKVIRELQVESEEELVPTREKAAPGKKSTDAPTKAPVEPAAVPA